MSKEERPICEHCNMAMTKWKTPPMSTWSAPFLYVCFNDECPYFVRGWDWMMESQNVKASYRNCVDPETGKSGPLPTWSYDAHKDQIMDE